MSLPVFVIFGLFFASILFMGYLHSKTIKNSDDFLVAGRNTGFWILVGTIVGTNVGGGTMIGFTAEAYREGVSALWPVLPMFLFMAIWIIFFVRYIARIRQTTLPDFLVLRFGERVRTPTAIFTLIRSIVMTGMQILAMAEIMSAILGWNMTLSLIMSFLITVIYCLLGGLRSVMTTDAMQTVIQSIGPLILLIVLITEIGDFTTIFEKSTEANPDTWNIWSPGWVAILGFIAASGPYYLVYQPMWQRVYAAKDEDTAYKSMVWGTILSFFTVLIPILIGVLSRFVVPSNIEPEQVLPWLYLEHLNPWLGAFFAVSLIAAVMSVLDSMVLDGSANLVRDIYQKRMKPNANDKQLVRMGRISVLTISLLGLIMSLALPNLVVLWVFANALAAGGVVIPVVAAWLYKNGTSAGAYWSLIGGGLGTIAWAGISWVGTGDPGSPYLGISPVYVGFVFSIILLILVSKNTPHTEDENPEKTLYSLNKTTTTSNNSTNNISIENVYSYFKNNYDEDNITN